MRAGPCLGRDMSNRTHPETKRRPLHSTATLTLSTSQKTSQSRRKPSEIKENGMQRNAMYRCRSAREVDLII